MPRPPLYSADEAARRLSASLPGWAIVDGWLARTIKTKDWRATMLAVNAIAQLADAADHHPNLDVAYASVGIKLQTHSAGGLTALDFSLAAKIDDVLGWRPQSDGP